ncbi:hypothetical protein D3C80_1693990 [compost metagenome]
MQPEGFLDRLFNRTGGNDVVFLDQEGIGKPQAMVTAAAAQHGIFQRGAQPWQSFAGVQ